MKGFGSHGTSARKMSTVDNLTPLWLNPRHLCRISRSCPVSACYLMQYITIPTPISKTEQLSRQEETLSRPYTLTTMREERVRANVERGAPLPDLQFCVLRARHGDAQLLRPADTIKPRRTSCAWRTCSSLHSSATAVRPPQIAA